MTIEGCFAAFWRMFDMLPIALKFVLYFFWAPLLEVMFYFRVRRYLRLRSEQKVPHTSEDIANVLAFWEQILEHEDDIESILRGWYPGEGELLAGNLLDMVGWTLYAVPAESLKGRQRETAESVLAKVRKVIRAQTGTVFREGYNPRRECMMHTLAPLSRCWKPLLFYLGTQAVRAVAAALLRRRGFALRSISGLDYWHHPGNDIAAAAAAAPLRTGAVASASSSSSSTSSSAPASSSAAEPHMPIVVLHGVGGFWLYLPLCLDLRRIRPDAPIIMPILRHCSILAPPFDPPPPLDTTDVVAGIAAAIRIHAPPSAPKSDRHFTTVPSASSFSSSYAQGAVAPAAAAQPPARPRAAFLGHSLGSALFASIAQQQPDLIAAALLVDPICFLLYRHHVLFNFLYRTPTPLRKSLSQLLHAGYFFRLALHYLLRQEPTIQSCFRREFWWARHWLHPDAMRSWPSKVVLSGRDAIVPAPLVHSYFLKLKLSDAGSGGGGGGRRPSAEGKATPGASAAVAVSAAAGEVVGARGASAPAAARGAHAELEMHERWHHGWSMLAPGSRGRLVVALCALIDEATGSKGGGSAGGGLLMRSYTSATYASSSRSSELSSEDEGADEQVEAPAEPHVFEVDDQHNSGLSAEN